MDDREISIQEIRKWLDMSPNQFIKFLNSDEPHLSTSWEEEYSKYKENIYPEGPFFVRGMLDNPDFTVHIQDWLEFKKITLKW